ncbi:hypothetical protein NDU88_000675 [Pleurodeles waltl]|uniref:General transcription factor 3C polypeptide 4 n=2 Tax=Pleurodeles waltl TaxID=8319 RepID=A0AAV7Q225_PLEWA|nr:hypothetical protein NDU88_000675 [Pleurodeles waltl]
MPGSSPRAVPTRREPAVRLHYPVSGPQPLRWSEDHCVSVCTSRDVSVLEHVSNIHSSAPELLLRRSVVTEPPRAPEVAIKDEAEERKPVVAGFSDPTVIQDFMLEQSFNPEGQPLPSMHGFRYASWSPMGCDANGRCLLATLTMDNRLTVYSSLDRLQWAPLVDLTELYGRELYEANFKQCKCHLSAAEIQRRRSMQTPKHMEWSALCTTTKKTQNNQILNVGSILLAVLFEYGNIAVWEFQRPFRGKECIISCDTIESGVAAPSILSWWEYEHSNRKMRGLIVGSSNGPIKILPVNLAPVKGYFTVRLPLVLWQDADQMPVHSIQCFSLYHPHLESTCSLVVAARGTYVFWCLLQYSKVNLNIHNSHVTELHSSPIVFMTVDKQSGTIYTCLGDGTVVQLSPVFTDTALKFEHQLIKLNDILGPVTTHGMGLSPCGAYMACVTTEGLDPAHSVVNKTYQVQFVTLKTFEEAIEQLLESPLQNLFKQVDLMDVVRGKILKDKQIPTFLQEALDKKSEEGGIYFWRLRLFLLRIYCQSIRKSSSEVLWRPSYSERKIRVTDANVLERKDSEEQESKKGEVGETDLAPLGVAEGPPVEEKVLELQGKIRAVEMRVVREHMKRVLGEVYLHTQCADDTSIPVSGICNFLTSDEKYDDHAARVLIGYVLMNKKFFHERCSLCKEVLPFADHRQAMCSNGHISRRCSLTYQTFEGEMYRKCLLHDSIARCSVPEDPEWLQRLLQDPCTFCDSPIF